MCGSGHSGSHIEVPGQTLLSFGPVEIIRTMLAANTFKLAVVMTKPLIKIEVIRFCDLSCKDVRDAPFS